MAAAVTPAPTQADSPIAIATPLGPDKLLLTGVSGFEAISQPFRFSLDLVALNSTVVPFEQVVGQPATIRLALLGGGERFFNGIISRFSQGNRDETFTHFRAEMVPQLWLLSRRTQSRIFQHVAVPDILKTVLAGLDVKFDILGTFEPRNYCVQYRESDLAFADRLMEEEGIFYFFQHTNGGHQMIVTNHPGGHPDVPGPTDVIFEGMFGGVRKDMRVTDSAKTQEVRSGKCTLWDHCFELPHKHLEAERPTQDTVPVGTVTHKLKIADNSKLELFDYPGGYAQRFDGIDKGGGERPKELEKIFEDNARTVGIRMQAETALAFEIRGASTCRHFVAGHRFTLTRHFDGDGPYVLTQVSHAARASVFRSDEGPSFEYGNTFTCIPAALPYRPPRVNPKPTVAGPQTAVVVGPPGEEIFCDKYGRVKVQFHWDREGKMNADSSCWMRVASTWAGKQWGHISLPRIGQEVVVDFLEGDPDRPIIVGSVYNADQMPPYTLPANKTQSGVKSRSTLKGTPENFNEIRFEDKKGREQVYIHAERNLDINVENDMSTTVGHDDTQTVHHNRKITVDGTHTEDIKGDTEITVNEGNFAHTVSKGDSVVTVTTGTFDHNVKGKVTETFANAQETTVKQDVTITSTTAKITIDAKTEILLVCGGSTVTIQPAKIMLSSGSGQLILDPTGATLLGAVVKIN